MSTLLFRTPSPCDALTLARQIGQILPTSTPFGGASAADLPRAERKRTLVDELVDDAEAARYAKRKFLDLQGQRARNGRGTLHERNKKRKPKW